MRTKLVTTRTECRVEKKIPPTNLQTPFISAVAIERDEEEGFAQNEMQDADGDEKSEAFPNFERRHEQNISDEHLLDLLVAFRGAAEKQDRRRGRDHVGETD